MAPILKILPRLAKLSVALTYKGAKSLGSLVRDALKITESRGTCNSIINSLMAKLLKIVAAEALHKQTKRMFLRFASIKTQTSKTNIS